MDSGTQEKKSTLLFQTLYCFLFLDMTIIVINIHRFISSKLTNEDQSSKHYQYTVFVLSLVPFCYIYSL